MKDSNKSVKATNIFLILIEKVFNVNFEIKGEENIPKDKSIMFVANHFTRFETFIIPYLLNKIKGLKYCRSLAHKTLFFGKFGDYLKSLKAVSTDDPKRNEIIISDLIKKKNNWIIYPEGQMMKDKKIFTSNPSLFKKCKVSAQTGAAVLAMEAEMQNTIKGEIVICPITISYRPIHAKRNPLYNLVKRFVNIPNLPKRVKEEMFFETSLLSFSKITIEFGKPVVVADYIKQNSKLLKFLPLTKEKKNDLILKNLRYPLTNFLMHQIYLKTPLSFDHFLSFIIYSFLKENITKISIDHLKETIFAYIANAILFSCMQCEDRFRISQSINTWNIPKLIIENEKFEIFNTALKELETKKLAKIENETLFLNKEALLKERDFHEIRLQNLFKVLYNEITYFKRIIHYNKQILFKSLPELKLENANTLKELMELDYKQDRELAGKDAKPEKSGMPFFLKGVEECSVLLSHGYKASPGEMKDLGIALNAKGFQVYGLRLKGHGTTPEDMKMRSAEDWLYSYKIGYEILFRSKYKIFLCGFSMGGLLTLIQSTELKNDGIISISAPLKVTDFKFNFTGIAKKLSDVLASFGTNIKDYVEGIPENPDTNYKRHYFASMVELKKLMKRAEQNLPNINSPALVIQGAKDGTVDAKSGMEIYKKIQSYEKEIYEPDFGTRHVIVRGEGSEKIVGKIFNFINSKL